MPADTTIGFQSSCFGNSRWSQS